MGQYVQGSLLADERVIYETRLHWVVFVAGALVLTLGLAAAAVTQLGLFAIVAGAGMLIAAIVTRSTSEFAVTNRRVIIKVGWIARRTMEMNLSKVESIDVNQDVSGTLLGYGEITVVGTGATRETFRRIADPETFRRAVQMQTQG